MPRKQTLLLALLSVVALAIAGCGPACVRVRGVAPLNLNAAGESTPVDVRFFALTDDARFLAAGFETLWTDADAALGRDLLGKPVQVAVYPGSPGDPPQLVTVPSAGGAWLGVLALYRRSDGQPRTLTVRTEEAGARVLELTGYGLRWQGADPDPAPAAAPARTGPRTGR